MDKRPYITCRELIEFLYLYLAGELPEPRVVEFERHLAVCPSCVAYIETYREAAALGRGVFAAEPEASAADSGVPEDLVRAVVAAAGKR